MSASRLPSKVSRRALVPKEAGLRKVGMLALANAVWLLSCSVKLCDPTASPPSAGPTSWPGPVLKVMASRPLLLLSIVKPLLTSSLSGSDAVQVSVPLPVKMRISLRMLR